MNERNFPARHLTPNASQSPAKQTPSPMSQPLPQGPSEVTWRGYVRKDGVMGIRNKILVMYTVECSHFVASQIVERAHDDDCEVVGFTGCTDNDYAVHLMISFIKHPNIGAVLMVGLGCEYTQPEWLSKIAEEEGKPTAWMFIQQQGGTRATIDKGVECVHRFREQLNHTPTAPMGLKDLIIGGECGGSDFTSGLAGNAVVGRFYDWLGDAGGCAIFEEVLEAIGLRDQLVARAASEQAAEELGVTYDKALQYCKDVHQFSVSPGNFAGGLSTIEEKSMGAVVKSGHRPIQGVIKVGQRPPHAGLWMMDSTPDPHFMQFGISNPNDTEGLMDLIACGAQIVFLVTGRGSVVGSAIAPTIKVTGNSETYRNLEPDMDFDASPILAGTETLDENAAKLQDLVIRVASGEQSKSEALGHKEYLIMYKYQDPHRVIPRCMLAD